MLHRSYGRVGCIAGRLKAIAAATYLPITVKINGYTDNQSPPWHRMDANVDTIRPNAANADFVSLMRGLLCGVFALLLVSNYMYAFDNKC